jgi:hypothetical protein
LNFTLPEWPVGEQQIAHRGFVTSTSSDRHRSDDRERAESARTPIFFSLFSVLVMSS